MTSQPSAQPPSDLEMQKLAFEKEKNVIEDRWKKKTFLWSIVATIIGSAVSVTIAIISSGSKASSPQPQLPNITSAVVENCRLSLQRLATLAMRENQTVVNLRDAIGRHVTDCDQILIEMRSYLDRSGR
jgi:hypothetical protein